MAAAGGQDCSTLRDLLLLKTDDADHGRRITTWKERDREAAPAGVVLDTATMTSTPSQQPQGIGSNQPTALMAQLSPLQESISDEPDMGDEGNGSKLAEISAKQLNQMLQGYDKAKVDEMKQKRRTLKNRGYALKCRMKRLEAQSNLEIENQTLREENVLLHDKIAALQERLQWYESCYNPVYQHPSAYPPAEFSNAITYAPDHHEPFAPIFTGAIATEPSSSASSEGGDLQQQSAAEILAYSLYTANQASSDMAAPIDPACPWGHMEAL